MENKVVKVIIGILVVSVVFGTLFFWFTPVKDGKKQLDQIKMNNNYLILLIQVINRVLKLAILTTMKDLKIKLNQLKFQIVLN
ncbi:hypothetical protein ABID30_003306 [Enterococcus rotai]|uniref:Uncharacterized protein n=1 Tax=Enterococcus rotai TaxID=118060 RepID=A0A0U2VDN4_9ENTE|nr:hypothetical protein [Enterococcus rotai]ALS35820.1 hypothetical protein ATZ35_01190 [Enterococcus rotai]